MLCLALPACRKVRKMDFQSQFSTSKIIRIFLNFFSLKNTNLGAHFLLLTFFDKISFLLLIWCPIFDSLPLIQNSKFNNFFWVCWFFCKNLPVLPYGRFFKIIYLELRFFRIHIGCTNYQIFQRDRWVDRPVERPFYLSSFWWIQQCRQIKC